MIYIVINKPKHTPNLTAPMNNFMRYLPTQKSLLLTFETQQRNTLFYPVELHCPNSRSCRLPEKGRWNESCFNH